VPVDPLNVPRIRRKIPSPFKRPSADLGWPEVRREWQDVPSELIEEGDIVAGAGIVSRVGVDGIDVTLWCGVPEPRPCHYYRGDAVLAFHRAS